MKHVSSPHHPLVTTCRALARARGAGDDRLLLDGVHLVRDAYQAGLSIEAAAATPRLLSSPEGRELVDTLARAGTDVVSASDAAMDALSPVTTPSGLVAIVRRPATAFETVLRHPSPLVLVASGVQDPGNVGAILRAAEAGGATGVVFGGGSADPFGWKALRGSMGSALRLPVVARYDIPSAVTAARAHGIRVLAAVPRDGTDLYGTDLTHGVALLLGGEGPGLSDEVTALADCRLSVPMRPPVESLNVAVAAALFVYEARRQRAGALPPGGDQGRA